MSAAILKLKLSDLKVLKAKLIIDQFNKLRQVSLWVILISSLIGCQPAKVSIQEISRKKTGKTIRLTGKVVHIAPFVNNAAYQIQDDTGAVWVVTSQKVPPVGKQLTIKGKINYQSLPFAESELGDFYLVELEQLESPEKTNK